jgi:hypothetical protein
MGFERLAEDRIRAAMNDGAFDRLPGAGKPLDLEEYFKTPADVRLAYSILKNAGCVPEEVELLKEIARLEHDVTAAETVELRQNLSRTLAARRLRLAVLQERRPKQR